MCSNKQKLTYNQTPQNGQHWRNWILNEFDQDNARTHTSLVPRQKLRELGYGILVHPTYIPDLAPSEYHLFLSKMPKKFSCLLNPFLIVFQIFFRLNPNLLFETCSMKHIKCNKLC